MGKIETGNINELIKDGEPLYLKNNSKPKGDVSIVVFRPDSSSMLVVIPKTWIPICVTDQVPAELLKSSIDLRKFIRNRLLIPVNREEAENVLKGEDAQEELRRLYVSKYAEWETAAQGIPGSTEFRKPSMVEGNIDTLVRKAHDGDKVSIQIKEVLSRQVDDNEKYQLLRADEEDFQLEDYEYLATNGEGKVKEWAQRMRDSLLDPDEKDSTKSETV